jgi:RNA polymerase sigma factor (sigma-70 family)
MPGKSKRADRLFTDHLRLVESTARFLHRRTGVSYEDLYQDGCIGLVSAARKFDSSRAIRFEHYARRWIKGEMLHGLRRARSLGWSELTPAIEPGRTDEHADPLLANRLRRAVESVSGADSQIVDLHFFAGLGFRTIARGYGMSVSSVHRAIARALVEMRANFAFPAP